MEILGSAIWKSGGGGELGAINEAEAVWDFVHLKSPA